MENIELLLTVSGIFFLAAAIIAVWLAATEKEGRVWDLAAALLSGLWGISLLQGWIGVAESDPDPWMSVTPLVIGGLLYFGYCLWRIIRRLKR